MRYAIAILGSLSIAGCAVTDVTAVDEQGFVPVPGLYATGDGTTVYSRTRLNADGTYVDLGDDGPTGQGTWTSDGSDMCFDPEGDAENQQERCWTNGPVGEDGSFLSTRVDTGQAYVVSFISE